MPVPTPQIGILGVRRSPTRFHQGCFQPRIAAPRATASRLASAFPVARAHRCPRCQMRRSRKLAHIGANLSDDHLGRPAVHPRDALQLSHLLDKRGDNSSTLASNRAIASSRWLTCRSCSCNSQRWWSRTTPRSACCNGTILRAIVPEPVRQASWHRFPQPPAFPASIGHSRPAHPWLRSPI